MSSDLLITALGSIRSSLNDQAAALFRIYLRHFIYTIHTHLTASCACARLVSRMISASFTATLNFSMSASTLLRFARICRQRRLLSWAVGVEKCRRVCHACLPDQPTANSPAFSQVLGLDHHRIPALSHQPISQPTLSALLTASLAASCAFSNLCIASLSSGLLSSVPRWSTMYCVPVGS